MSGPWFLRDETLFLLPGDSPIGYRLPMDSLPWVAEKDFPWAIPKDPTRDLPPLVADSGRRIAMQRRAAEREAELPAVLRCPRQKDSNMPAGECGSVTSRELLERQPGEQESAPWITRSALCVEPRDGRLHVFLPPVKETEDFLDLIACIEQTAASLKMPVIIEGTPPEYDPRIEVLKVTPDPGVIEVNLQPAASWDELVHNTSVLYEEAHQCRLATEKFMVDGRHCGTGGGNHIIIGGETPSDSPMLRRPDLLRSMVTFWNHHPSLSYLFSGLVRRSHLAGTADRRGAQRFDPRAGGRLQNARRQRTRRCRGMWTARSATC